MNYRILPFSKFQIYNFGNMNEASSSSSLNQQLAEITEENRVNFYSNDFHLEPPKSYNYYQQQPDHIITDVLPLQYPSIVMEYQREKLPDWQCLQSFQATQNPRKRMSDGCDQNINVNKKLAQHIHERMQGVNGRVRERVPMRRSQKLADKITALQKLVSPYGKTDTASVLQEAHISINFLHDQIQELLQKTQNSAENVRPVQFWNEEAEIGLRERGLCLVPISTPEINSLCFGKHNFMPGSGNY
ncbi:hypothetical protein Lser_V15G08714 [Lactuca serriola]